MKQLVTVGPYSVCRNPLYFFSMLLGIGLGFCTETFTVPILIALVLALLYYFQIKREEQALLRAFGAEYEVYLANVPRFFPSHRRYSEPEEIRIRLGIVRAGAMHSASRPATTRCPLNGPNAAVMTVCRVSPMPSSEYSTTQSRVLPVRCARATCRAGSSTLVCMECVTTRPNGTALTTCGGIYLWPRTVGCTGNLPPFESSHEDYFLTTAT